jgi:hypothetical protein
VRVSASAAIAVLCLPPKVETAQKRFLLHAQSTSSAKTPETSDMCESTRSRVRALGFGRFAAAFSQRRLSQRAMAWFRFAHLAIAKVQLPVARARQRPKRKTARMGLRVRKTKRRVPLHPLGIRSLQRARRSTVRAMQPARPGQTTRSRRDSVRHLIRPALRHLLRAHQEKREWLAVRLLRA